MLFWITLAPSLDDVARTGAQLSEAKWAAWWHVTMFKITKWSDCSTFLFFIQSTSWSGPHLYGTERDILFFLLYNLKFIEDPIKIL